MSVTMADRDASSTWMYFAGSGGLPAPLPWIGSQATASRTMTAVKTPPKIVLWWERLEVWQQLAISFPVFAVLTFLLNIGPFDQAILRSVFYGVCEGGLLAGLLAVSTRTEGGR